MTEQQSSKNLSPLPLPVIARGLLPAEPAAPSGRWLLLATGILSLLVFAAHLHSLGDTPSNAVVADYLCAAAAQILLALGTILILRRVSHDARRRWLLLTGSVGIGLLGYLTDAAGHFYHLPELDFIPGTVWCFNIRETLLLVCVTLAFHAVPVLRTLDIAQALLFAGLRFSVSYTPRDATLTAVDYLNVTQIVAGFLCALACIAAWAAEDQEDRRSLRLIALVVIGRFIDMFLSNIVGVDWFHQEQQSPWSVAGTSLTLVIACYLVFVAGRPRTPAPFPLRSSPGLLIRSLLPSFLAAGNIVMCILLAGRTQSFAMAGLITAMILYAARLVVAQKLTLDERLDLLTRNQELALLADRDPLTQVGNRRSFDTAFERLTHHHPALVPLALILTDADCFKQANDQHGHLYGDQVLLQIAVILQEAAAQHPGSHCSRHGGDEFAVLLPGLDQAAARRFGDEVRQAVDALQLPAGTGQITLSVGVTVVPLSPELPLAFVLACADIALYHAKKLGRNRVECHIEADVDEPAPTLIASPS